MEIDMCRICFSKAGLQDLYEKSGSISLCSKFTLISHVQILENDNLPPYLCELCVSKVNEFYDFRRKIEISENYLRKISLDTKIYTHIKKHANKAIDDESLSDLDKVDDLPDEQCFPVEILEPEIEFKSDRLRDKQDNQQQIKSKQNTNTQGKVPIQCSTCGKLISSRFRLKCHMRIHTGEKPFKCSVCSKSFAIAYNLKVHGRVHTGEKPLQCKECNKRFAQSASLISHMRLHTGENPYKCHMCPKEFKTNSHLKYHIRLHTGEKNFICETCNKAFVARSDLTQHERTHTGERSHICMICGIRLTRAYHLERHMITHTGVKNFRCETCGLAYSQRYDLNRHMKTHNHLNSIVKTEENGICIGT